MIVKNESQVIARALQSVLGIIDYWVICDTGSSDDTPAVILNTLGHIPGELHRVDWVNFGHNRTQVLQLARGKSDYFLLLDADMIANVYGDFKAKLTADFYHIRYEGTLDYSQPMLLSDRHEWEFVGATHEFVKTSTDTYGGQLPELTLTHFGDGGMRTDKFERDIRLLLETVEKEPDNSRAVFYLAQSYKDIDDYENALFWYRRRLELEGWDEETWYASYQTARMLHLLNAPWEKVLSAYLKAYQQRPQRLEPLYPVVRYYRENEAFQMGHLYASVISVGWQYPNSDHLFIEKPVYDYLMPLEYGVCAFSVGRASEAVKAFNTVLRQSDLPGWVSESAIRGRGMALALMFPALSGAELRPRNKIKVLTAFHNAGPFLERCLASLQEQDYPNFEVIFLDDASTDGYHEIIPIQNDRFQLIRRDLRMGLAANLHQLLLDHCEPDDIAVVLDGDDWLACSDALSWIDRCYREQDCWVLYGQFQYSTGEYGFSQPFATPDDFHLLRQRWQTTHIKTFRAGLYQRIADQDPDFSCMKDNNGEWLKAAVDSALMFPLLEMAGFDKVRFNEKILYIYNDDNPLSHHKTNLQYQSDRYNELKIRRPFAAIKHY